MKTFGRKGQGEGLIKLLVIAIIAIIAIAVAKSYFREASKTTQKTVQEVFSSSMSTSSMLEDSPLSSRELVSLIKT